MARITFTGLPALTMVMVAGFLTARAGWQDEYAGLLKKYVGPDGVAYASWHASREDVAKLGEVVTAIGAVDPGGYTREDKLAFYINAYNAWMLHLVLAHYPIPSVKDIGSVQFSVFKTARIIINGRKRSLDYLEKDLLLKQLGEPRVHFAVSCASKGCPPLASEPYEGGRIDEQLERYTRAFLNSAAGVQIHPGTDSVSVTRLFDWYHADFEPSGGLLTFISRYRDTPLAANVSIHYLDYDWALNETSGK